MSHSCNTSKWQYLLATLLVATMLLCLMFAGSATASNSLDALNPDNPKVTLTKLVGSKAVFATGEQTQSAKSKPKYRICTTTTRTLVIGTTPIRRIDRVTPDGRPFVEAIYELTESYSGRTYKVAGRFKCNQNYGRTLSEWALPNMKSQISDFVPAAPAAS